MFVGVTRIHPHLSYAIYCSHRPGQIGPDAFPECYTMGRRNRGHSGVCLFPLAERKISYFAGAMEDTTSVLRGPSAPVTTTFFPVYLATAFRSLRTQASSPDCSVYFGSLVTGHCRAQLGPTQRLS
jgi:hypothetical protein